MFRHTLTFLVIACLINHDFAAARNSMPYTSKRKLGKSEETKETEGELLNDLLKLGESQNDDPRISHIMRRLSQSENQEMTNSEFFHTFLNHGQLINEDEATPLNANDFSADSQPKLPEENHDEFLKKILTQLDQGQLVNEDEANAVNSDSKAEDPEVNSDDKFHDEGRLLKTIYWARAGAKGFSDSRNKRTYGSALRLGIAGLAGTAFAFSVAQSIYAAIRKCNDFRPNNCGNKPNCTMLTNCPDICHGPETNFLFIDRMKEAMKVKLTELDQLQLAAFNLATKAISANLVNKHIMIEIDRINDMVTQLMFDMLEFDLNVAEKFRNESVAIKTMLRNSRLSLDDIIASKQVDGIFDKWTWEGTGTFVLMLALPVGLYFFQKIRERMAINQIAKNLRADFEIKFTKQKATLPNHASMRNAFIEKQGYGTKAFNKQIKQTAKALYFSDQANHQATRTEKFMTNVVGPLVNIVVALISAWSAYNYFTGCQTFVNKMHDDAKTMVNKVNEIADIEINHVRPLAAQVITQAWNPVKTLLTGNVVLGWLDGIKNLTLGADNVNQTTINTIDYFIANIGGADVPTTLVLQKSLLGALESVKFDIGCLQQKEHALATVLRSCKAGHHTLENLYNDASKTYKLNSQMCIAENKVKYTSLVQFKEIVDAFAKHQGWYSNCLLNSHDLLLRVCAQKLKGYTKIDDIVKYANNTDLTNAMAEDFLTRCPPPQITPKGIKDTCKYYCLYEKSADIAKSVVLTVDQVNSIIANNCTICSYRDDQKTKICKEHFCQGVNASTLETQVRLPLRTVQHIIANVCPQKCILTADEKLKVCQYHLCKELPATTITTRLGIPISAINELTPNCTPIPVANCPVGVTDIMFLRYFKCTAKKTADQVYILKVVEMSKALIVYTMGNISC